MKKFWEIFDDRLELCREALMIRYNNLLGTKARISPIHYMYGAIARLKPDDTIDELLKDGYATISLGYTGIYEAVQALIGESNTTEKGRELSMQIIKHMKDAVNKWKEETHIGFALYGTPKIHWALI